MATKDLSSKKGTIANVFTKRRDDLFALIETNQYEKLQVAVNELLDDPSLDGNPAVAEAKLTLKRCSAKRNLYYSTLMTYMTGMKVSY